MKYLLTLITILTFSACSILGGGEPEVKPPVVREDFHPCPDYPKCAGKYKSGGICEPSGSHHSAPDKCPRIK